MVAPMRFSFLLGMASGRKTALQQIVEEQELMLRRYQQQYMRRPDSALVVDALTPATGIYRANLGQPSRRLSCPNCGAPHEPVRCSYCLTPSR